MRREIFDITEKAPDEKVSGIKRIYRWKED